MQRLRVAEVHRVLPRGFGGVLLGTRQRGPPGRFLRLDLLLLFLLPLLLVLPLLGVLDAQRAAFGVGFGACGFAVLCCVVFEEEIRGEASGHGYCGVGVGVGVWFLVVENDDGLDVGTSRYMF
jgi:hypothetical protein